MKSAQPAAARERMRRECECSDPGEPASHRPSRVCNNWREETRIAEDRRERGQTCAEHEEARNEQFHRKWEAVAMAKKSEVQPRQPTIRTV